MPAEDPRNGQPPTTLPDSYRTLAGPGQAELKVQRSRFLALAAPADDEDQARRFLTEAKARFHDARHLCHAWRIGGPPEWLEARNDDGEPAGTGGEPILAEIRKQELGRTVVGVVRYFGGIKLGTGGLARAYGQAAAEALAAAPSRTVLLGRRFRLGFPYSRQKTIARLLESCGGRAVAESYGIAVDWDIWLPHSRWAEFARQLREATAGSVAARPLD